MSSDIENLLFDDLANKLECNLSSKPAEYITSVQCIKCGMDAEFPLERRLNEGTIYSDIDNPCAYEQCPCIEYQVIDVYSN